MKIAIIGLGYVGLPLARLFGTKYSVVGFDINSKRIEKINSFLDDNLEISLEELEKVKIDSDLSLKGEKGVYFTSIEKDINGCDCYIVTVPTPVDNNNNPDLSPLKKASETVGKYLKNGNIVIYESTVYPTCTRDFCVPILEEESGLKLNEGFFVGYSPERINPGDKIHTVENIDKITSGSDEYSAKVVDDLYKSVLKSKTYLAPSIEVAEAAKIVENTQRDVNIAFINELSKIFSKIDIDTKDVLDAAGTKWNFIRFMPGLVGGHCTGVDPYYLAKKAQEVGVCPEVILSARRTNNSMGDFIAQEVVRMMIDREIPLKGADVLVLGISFKENCPDIRNSKVVDVVRSLQKYYINVSVCDPYVDENKVFEEFGVLCTKDVKVKKYSGIVLAVAHDKFLSLDFDKLKGDKCVVYDVKSVLDKSDKRL